MGKGKLLLMMCNKKDCSLLCKVYLYLSFNRLENHKAETIEYR